MLSTLAQLNPQILPLSSTEWADLTPEVVFAALSNDPSLFWLDSGTSKDRWHFIGAAPFVRVDPEVVLTRSALHTKTPALTTEIPPFGGVLVQIDYPSGKPPFSLSGFGLKAYAFDTVLAYSPVRNRWFSIVNSGTTAPEQRAQFLHHILRLCTKCNQRKQPIKRKTSNITKVSLRDMHYLWAIRCALHYIETGDIYQINISKRFTAPWRSSPAALYLRMRGESPPAHGAYLGPALTSDDRAICCISPELFLRVEGSEIVTRPIKGTRPLGGSAAEITAARRELETSPKERAELNMIVDLERNDLGRVCSYGSVRVVSPGEVEQLPTLLHRTATIRGTLRPETTIGDLLDATFPGGSITGAPKIRAMQLIAQIEHEPRGPYCGAIGWVGLNGGLELNIAIRTAVVDTVNGLAHYHAGSGIVADSDPEKECEETLLKAAPFFRAVSD